MIRLFRQYISPRKTIFIIGEGVLIFIAISIGSYVLLGRDMGMFSMLGNIWHKVLLVAVTAQLSLYFNDLYESQMSGTNIDLASRLLQSIGVTSITLAIIYFFRPDMIIGRWIFFLSLIFLLFFLVSWRFLYSAVINRKLFTEKALIMGSDELATDILREIEARKDLSYNVSLIVTHNKNHVIKDELNGIPIHTGFETLCDLVEAENIKTVIVALDEKRGVFPHQELLKCKVRGTNIIDGESFYERITGKLLVEKINPSWLIFSDGFSSQKPPGL